MLIEAKVIDAAVLDHDTQVHDRLTYGVCESDVWSFDDYLERVIANGCTHLRNLSDKYLLYRYSLMVLN